MAEFLLVGRQQRVRIDNRVFRPRVNNFLNLSNEAFTSRYRLPKDVAFDLVEELRGDLDQCGRSQSISAEIQVLTTLHFLASGSFQRTVGDVHGVSKSTASRCISKVVDALCKRVKDYISFPEGQDDLVKTIKKTYDIAGMPHCIGFIDGTQIEIIAPSNDIEHHFVCRKGYHSLNIQAVCNADLLFLNVVSKWPGSTHDSFIWNNCSLQDKFRPGGALHKKGFLLGDSGYPLSPWLLTPVMHPTERKAENYNRCHKRSRNTIERAFGVLKSRWRAVHTTGGALSYSPEKSAKLILACFILHNICIINNVPFDDDMPNQDDNINNDRQPENNDGRLFRAALIQTRF